MYMVETSIKVRVHSSHPVGGTFRMQTLVRRRLTRMYKPTRASTGRLREKGMLELERHIPIDFMGSDPPV